MPLRTCIRGTTHRCTARSRGSRTDRCAHDTNRMMGIVELLPNRLINDWTRARSRVLSLRDATCGTFNAIVGRLSQDT